METKELVIGAGNRPTKRVTMKGLPEDWTNLITLDMSKEANPSVVWDLNNLPYPFANDEFTEIHAYEVLEHIGKQGDWRFFFNQFDEFARILKPKGIICITAPKFDSPWAWGDPGHTRYIGPESYLFLNRTKYDEQVGKTAMCDYRPFFTSDWRVIAIQPGAHSIAAILVNIK